MKVDVAVQSYMKPESLLYTLMTLKEHSGAVIDTVFINDDCSGPDVVDRYRHPAVARYFAPWKIRVRVNTHPIKWGPGFVFGYRPRYLRPARLLKFGLKNLHATRRFFFERENIRYQWALEQTDKKYLFVVHDDVEFYQDLVSRYLSCAEGLTRPGLVGDLGQCWKCPHAAAPESCHPRKIMQGRYPSAQWPVTGLRRQKRICRINEWACLLSVSAAADILRRERVFFGNCDDFGDTAAFWFDRAVALGYSFCDPLPAAEDRAAYYLHGWQGHSGHSVWVDQGGGKRSYDKEKIEKRMQEKYGVILP